MLRLEKMEAPERPLVCRREIQSNKGQQFSNRGLYLTLVPQSIHKQLKSCLLYCLAFPVNSVFLYWKCSLQFWTGRREDSHYMEAQTYNKGIHRDIYQLVFFLRIQFQTFWIPIPSLCVQKGECSAGVATLTCTGTVAQKELGYCHSVGQLKQLTESKCYPSKLPFWMHSNEYGIKPLLIWVTQAKFDDRDVSVCGHDKAMQQTVLLNRMTQGEAGKCSG